MTGTNNFRSVAKEEICKIENAEYGRNITHEDVEVVFMSYVMGNMKATLVVPKDTQGRYYEASYSSLGKKIYIDVYNKTAEKVVQL